MNARIVTAVLVGMGMLVGADALAVEWKSYGEFRHTLGLPGNGFGVDENGQIGAGGARHMSVPCAYTPARGNYAVTYYSGSEDNSIQFEFGGHKTESTGHWGIGLGKPGRGIYVAEAFVEKHLSVNAYHLQWQVVDETEDTPAVAVGVFDIFDQRQEMTGIPHGARSFYAVASRKVTGGDKPLYASLGIGSGRFNDRPFGGVSWYPARNVNLGVEYDGLLVRPHASYQVHDKDEWGVSLGLGWADFDRPASGFTITRGGGGSRPATSEEGGLVWRGGSSKADDDEE